MIELRLLEHAMAVAEHRSFARAARALHISQPALSRSIQALEARLGLRFFDRASKGVEPTDAARVLLGRARGLAVLARDLEREAELLRGLETGELVIAAGPYPAEMVLGPAVSALVGRHRGIRIRIIVDHWVTLAETLRRREAELAICELSQMSESEFDTFPLPEHQGYFVVRAGHPLGTCPVVSLSEVMRWPLVMTARLPPRLLQELAQATGELRRPGLGLPAVQCENLEVVRQVVEGSDAVGAFPLPLVEPQLRAGKLVALPLVLPWLRTNYGLVRVKGRTFSPVAEAFIAEVRAIDARLLDREQDLARQHAACPGTAASASLPPTASS